MPDPVLRPIVCRRFATAAAIAVLAPLAALVSAAPAAAQTHAADDAAWTKAAGAGSIAAYRGYLDEFPQGAHTEEAQMQIIDLTLAAPAVKSNVFDGTWWTTVACPSTGRTLGFTYKFAGQVKDGEYHGSKGAEGEGGWYALEGRIAPDGDGAMLAKGIIGSMVAIGNSPAGNAYAYHVMAHFGAAGGTGKRVEGRVCNLTFVRE